MAVSDQISPLHYSIHSWSSFSGDFSPDQILTDNPSDPKSRWLSSDNRLPQFLTLRLEQPAIVRSILFGKFDRSHPCNLRKFRIYGGMDPDHLHLLIEDGLSNDANPETFDLQPRDTSQVLFPCRYIQIAPTQSWGYSFNFSVWYVELKGSTDKALLDETIETFEAYCNHEAVRLCLKHMREYEYTEAFEALQKKTKVSLEHSLLTQLHGLLVVKGDFNGAEKLLSQAAEDGHLDSYISEQPVDVYWTNITSKGAVSSQVNDTSAVGSCEKGGPGMPGGRGGHQMVIDHTSQTIYLHGGWDGTNDLADLWRYDIVKKQWTCLFHDTSLEGGPSPRSCHKMCIDCRGKNLYILGQYLDHPTRSLSDLPAVLLADFYCYSISDGSWTLLSSDTYSDGGPKLIFDHQMCHDSSTNTLYVFGGRILSNVFLDGGGISYSGLYAYHMTDRQWVCLRPDLASQPYKYSLKPRMAHTMILDSENHVLYILGGQRDKLRLSDMLVYDLLSDTTTILADGDTAQIPASGFTVRTNFNPDKSQICLFASLSRFDKQEEKEKRQISKTCSNSLWIYDIQTMKWKCIYQGVNGQISRLPSCSTEDTVPIPRFAHQFVYDHIHEVYFMFGGNPGNIGTKPSKINPRLDDFWQLKLVCQTTEELLRHCHYSIRKLRFSELAVCSPVEAISYLQSDLAALVDHNNETESTEFRELPSALFLPTPSSRSTDQEPSLFNRGRNRLYRKLSSYFPQHMTQPQGNITDLIRL